MSRNIKRMRIIVIAVLLVMLGIIYVFDPFMEQVLKNPNTISNFRYTGDYKINPETIVASLGRGEKDVFMPQLAPSDAYTSVSEGSIPWQQSDYFKIANALHQFVWKETTDNWHLYRMKFTTSCKDNLIGFGIGDFVYYKPIFTQQGHLRYTAREMIIHPLDSNVTWGGGTNFPHPLFGWKSVNLSKLKVVAEDALKIAEENGGKASRLSVQDECTIYLNLSGYSGWSVAYHGAGDRLIFMIQIDPYTGNIR